MPSSDIQVIEDMITQYINQYAVDAFSNQRLRTILLLMNQVIAALAGNVNPNVGGAPILVTSANFIDETNCPLTALAGRQLAIFWNDQNRYLKEGTDWTPLSGGGFKILLPDFDSTQGSYEFYVAS